MQATIEVLPEGQLEIKLTPETDAEYRLAAAWARQHEERTEIMEAMRTEIAALRQARLRDEELRLAQAAYRAAHIAEAGRGL